MKIEAFLGERAATAFAQNLRMLPRRVHYGADACDRLAHSLREVCQGSRAVVLFDRRTRDAAGDACFQSLRTAGWILDECLVPDGVGGRSPVCDDITKECLKKRIDGGDVFVAVGSGVVNDLTKWIAAEASKPYAVYATAASMNGYAAANVAPAIRGVKSLFRARAPVVIAADPAVIASAPHVMTAAGLGDLVAKPVSTADWLLGQHLFGEAFSPSIAAIIDRVEPLYLSDPQAIAMHAPEAMRALFDALVLSGCAMTLQGSSLPASGGEHLLSHTLDMLATVDGSSHDLHGRQVGVATVFAAELYRRIAEISSPTFEPPRNDFDASTWGHLAEQVLVEHVGKQQATRHACALLAERGAWTSIRESLRPLLRRPEAIKQCLADAGAAHRLKDIGCSRGRFLLAVRSCCSIRKRFTSVDLAFACGVLPRAAEEIVDQFLV